MKTHSTQMMKPKTRCAHTLSCKHGHMGITRSTHFPHVGLGPRRLAARNLLQTCLLHNIEANMRVIDTSLSDSACRLLRAPSHACCSVPCERIVFRDMRRRRRRRENFLPGKGPGRGYVSRYFLGRLTERNSSSLTKKITDRRFANRSMIEI